MHKIILAAFLFFIHPVMDLWADVQTQRYVLDNQMTVLITPMPNSPIVSLYLLVKTGSATEGKYLGSGISHFVEHMLFKGTRERPVGAIAREINALGGRINAATSFDYTVYTLDVPAQAFEPALNVLADMVMNSVFDPQEVKKEQDVIFGEMRMINDRPERALGNLVFKSAFLHHPYRHPIIGYVPLFANIKPDDLLEYYKTHYVPNNMVLSIAGPGQIKDIYPRVKEVFEPFKPGPYPDRNLPIEPQQVISRRVLQTYPSESFRFTMAYQGVSLFDRDMYALDLLAVILGQGDSSRLNQEIFKNKKLVESIHASNYTPIDRGIFEISAVLSKNNVTQAMNAVKEQLENIKLKGVTPKELNKAKRQLMVSSVFDRQTSSNMAYKTVIDEAFTGDFAFEEKYLQRIRQTTGQDVRQAAQKFLTDERLTVVVMSPHEDDTSKIVNQTPDSEILKTTLPNGLIVLLKEDHGLPIVSVSVVMNAGTRAEPDGFNGLNQLTADLWPQATRQMNSQQLAEMVEERGIAIDSKGGRNTMSLTIDFLSEDWPFVLDLLEGFLTRPHFDQDDFIRQKEKNLSDIQLQNDSIMEKGFQTLREQLFEKHPVRLNMLGTQASLQNISAHHVRDFYKKHAVAGNMVVSVFGDVNSADMQDELRARLGNLNPGSIESAKFFENMPDKLREFVFSMDKQQAGLFVGYHAPSMFDSSRYAMQVIESIFGASLNGRMFSKIREELGDAYTLGAYYVPNLDTGMMYFYVLTDESRIKDVSQVLMREIQQVQDTLVTAEELSAAQAHLKGNFALHTDTLSELGLMVALDELYGLGYQDFEKYAFNIDQVTAQRVQETARKYLNPNTAAKVIVRPQDIQKP